MSGKRIFLLLGSVLLVSIVAAFIFEANIVSSCEKTAKNFLTEVFTYTSETSAYPEPENWVHNPTVLEPYVKTRFEPFLTEQGFDRFMSNRSGSTLALESQNNGTFYNVDNVELYKDKAFAVMRYFYVVDITVSEADGSSRPVTLQGTVVMARENRIWKVNEFRPA